MNFFKNWIRPNRYERAELLENYLRSQYGPFLKENPYFKSENFYQTILSIASEYIDANTSALDIGCATGRLVFEYEKLGTAQSVGLDSSKRFIDCCKQIQKGLEPINFKITPNTKTNFIHADIFSETLKRESFSFISCINVIDRVLDPKALIHKIHEILNKNGVLLLVDPYDWARSPTPKKSHITDMKLLLDQNLWTIAKELKNIEYTLPISSSRNAEYQCHLIVAKKK